MKVKNLVNHKKELEHNRQQIIKAFDQLILQVESIEIKLQNYFKMK